MVGLASCLRTATHVSFTLPKLEVVEQDPLRTIVMADIPLQHLSIQTSHLLDNVRSSAPAVLVALLNRLGESPMPTLSLSHQASPIHLSPAFSDLRLPQLRKLVLTNAEPNAPFALVCADSFHTLARLLSATSFPAVTTLSLVDWTNSTLSAKRMQFLSMMPLDLLGGTKIDTVEFVEGGTSTVFRREERGSVWTC
ncbi:hypothetical protein RQP46_005106 [Phenoliferia psychrophenolica]